MANKKILVTGATGATGASAVQALLEMNIPVRAMVHGKDARASQLTAQVCPRWFDSHSERSSGTLALSRD